jgi:hypothetical protein
MAGANILAWVNMALSSESKVNTKKPLLPILLLNAINLLKSGFKPLSLALDLIPMSTFE